MLFNSHVFLLIFLPLVLGVHLLIVRGRPGWLATTWLVCASLFFYGWWNPSYLLLIALSIVVNFAVGTAITRSRSESRRSVLCAAGIVFDLGLLGYFKYAGLFARTTAWLTGIDVDFGEVALPLAISFFTFQQIAYLMDARRGEVCETHFLRYCLFVTFFPQLIAGPIVHHKEMMPQFEAGPGQRSRTHDIAVGITILALGLFKKVVLADGIAEYSTPIFSEAALGRTPALLPAWGAGLGYSMQIYFDFSGYSDMAIGLGRMFGIILPLNFDSPYKSHNIIEFWRRWHMTLSRFLRDYLYIPLGGNRRGRARRYANLFITMLLGGLWHGAGWTFVLWGGIHGVFLIVNHGWHAVKRRMGRQELLPSRLGEPLSRMATFLGVMLAFVIFKAESVGTSTRIFAGMIGLGEGGLVGEGENAMSVAFALTLAGLLAIAFIAPSTQEVMADTRPALGMGPATKRDPLGRIRWSPSPPWALGVLLLLCVSLYRITVDGYAEFLYRFF